MNSANKDWILNLSDEDVEFIKKFVLNSGSLKNIAKIYNVSYPTVRLRLDRVIQQIELNNDNANRFSSYIMQLAVDEKINFNLAKEILEKHQEELKKGEQQ